MNIKTRSDAIHLVGGGTQAGLAKKLGITKAYVNQWAEQLTTRQIDWVMGAAIRHGLLQALPPEKILDKST